MLSQRVIQILILIATHFTLTAGQIRRLVFGDQHDRDGRQTRRILAEMLRRQLIQKTHMEVTNPLHPVTASVYYPSKTGCEALARQTENMAWLLTNCQTPQWQNLRHFLQMSELRILIQSAIAAQDLVAMPHFYNEFDIVNVQATRDNPAERYRLYTVCSTVPHRIICCPDAAFCLKDQEGGGRAYYVELETGSNPFKAAAEKTPGYAALEAGHLYRKHFPEMDRFAVLVFAPNASWRDGLRKSFRKKERPDLYRFAALTELTPQNFLHGKVFYLVGEGPFPLVKL
jgi:hypothetical protein